MQGLVRPNVVAAVLDRLRADPDVSALCAQRQPPQSRPRIGTEFPETDDLQRRWAMPDYAVLIGRAGGPPPDLETSRRWARLDVRCYGHGRTLGLRRAAADRLWATVDPVLCPPQGISTAFHAHGCIVADIYAEAEPIPDIERGTDWPLLVCSYVVEYRALQVAA